MIAKAKGHAQLADTFTADEARARWHDGALWFIRQKRDRQAAALPEWESLREMAHQIKAYTLENLAELLEQFERAATQAGAVVHWAADAQEHNRIVLDIHIKKEEVGETFHQHIGTPKGNADPTFLTRAARGHLRQQFLGAQAGITGVNFAIAETGGIVICTNEGNADLGTSLPPIHIACMGIEKLLPRFSDLAVFTRLLARSATGQPITTYTSHFHGPMAGGQLHLILVDNGRTAIRESDEFHRSLHCIRCGACMNTCPVYRRSGGHSYQTTVPGPIGSILAPARDAKEHQGLPFACTLCGSCTDVCPVKIDLHHQLLAWRKEISQRRLLPATKKYAMYGLGWLLRHPRLYALAGWMGRKALRWMPRWMIYHRGNAWGMGRELPVPPVESFRAQWRKRGSANGPANSSRSERAGRS